MTCPDCQKAQTIKHWGGYHANCHGCKVRSLACGPAYFTAMQANAMTPGYRSALQVMFGENWKQAHEEVKAEHQRLQGMQQAIDGGVLPIGAQK